MVLTNLNNRTVEFMELVIASFLDSHLFCMVDECGDVACWCFAVDSAKKTRLCVCPPCEYDFGGASFIRVLAFNGSCFFHFVT